MAVYAFPGEGRIRVERHGEDGGPDRHTYRVAYMDEDPERFGGRVLKTWITVPFTADPRRRENRVVGAAIAAVEHEIARATGDHTGTVLALYGDDIEGGTDDAARYRTGSRASFYALVPGTLFEETTPTYASRAALRDAVRYQDHEGDVIDVYRNGADEPDGHYTVGPRGGLTWEKY